MVGAGIGQHFLAQKVKDRGNCLLTVTLPGKQPVIEIADKVLYNNVFDKDGVLALAIEQKIDGVISDQNDTMMPTVAYVAEKLNLPGLRINQAKAYCDKNVFRDNCDKLDIPVPNHTKVTSIVVPSEFEHVPFPWIVKPADSQSSVGVAKVDTIEEYLTAVEKALNLSKTNSAIVEEFFAGQELVAEGFIYEGKYYNLGFADRRYFRLDNLFIPSQTIFPSVVDEEILNSICECEKKMASYIKPQFAIVHSEYLYNESTKEYRVVESALRGGGVYISSHLVPLYCGVDVNDVLLDCVEGNRIDVDKIFRNSYCNASAYICFYLPEGKISSIEGVEELSRLDFVKMLSLNELLVGQKIDRLTNKGQRLGPIIISGSNRTDIEEKIKIVQNILKINVVDIHGVSHGINWE